MTKATVRILLCSALLVFTLSMACNALSRVQENVGEVRETAFAVGTEIGQGKEFLGTLEALGTQVSESDLVNTLQAAATEIDESGAFETAQAFATEQGSRLVQTAQAFVTEQGPSIQQTAQAFATEQGPELVETMQAAATQLPSALGEAPPDIPMIDGEKENLFTSSGLISYSTQASFNEAVSFYKTQMPTQGWTLNNDATQETESSAVLIFNKAERTASVTLTPSPFGGGTLVVITIF